MEMHTVAEVRVSIILLNSFCILLVCPLIDSLVQIIEAMFRLVNSQMKSDCQNAWLRVRVLFELPIILALSM